MFDGKNILITGATGSFGNAFIKKLLQDHSPDRVVVYSRDELKQFEMSQVLNQKCMRYFLGDVRDKERLELAMKGIDYVIHAAALKQVPAAECLFPKRTRSALADISSEQFQWACTS